MHHSLTNQTFELFRNKVTGFYVAEVQARMMLKMPGRYSRGTELSEGIQVIFPE